MKLWVLELLICPHCAGEVALVLDNKKSSGEDIIEGQLSCTSCARVYPITNGIPRFVAADENYAENFGYQWQLFSATQIDRLGGHNLSGGRLLNDTKWEPAWIEGKIILDAGCGAGRFADELAQAGARVVACDLSSAVDACKETSDNRSGHSANRGEVNIIQANLLALPFKPGVFYAVHCAGVIQHTPDPAKIMQSLPAYLRSSGRLFYNFYEKVPSTKFQILRNLLRLWTPGWEFTKLVTFSRWLCWVFFIPSFIMSRIRIVRYFNRFLPICSVHPSGLTLRQQFHLTWLDTVDWYGPKYEIRQDHKQVARLLNDQGLSEVEADAGRAWAVKQ
ncbi:MAG: methyltransferase domain-containing protein [Rhodospirillaceae bacterium]|nr:methyltransferase domain-containing protein [Rhodospirillaceae bacterium]